MATGKTCFVLGEANLQDIRQELRRATPDENAGRPTKNERRFQQANENTSKVQEERMSFEVDLEASTSSRSTISMITVGARRSARDTARAPVLQLKIFPGLGPTLR